MLSDFIFRAVIDVCPLATAVIDSRNKILYVNNEFTKVTLFKGSEVVGRNVNDNLPYMCEFADKSIWESLHNEQQWIGNAKNIKKNGKFYWENVQVYKISLSPPIEDIYVVFKEDITDRIQKETQMMISKKMESIGQLAAGIAHEINSPLQFITDSLYFVENTLQDMISYTNSIDEMIQMLPENNEVAYIKELVNKFKSTYDIDFLKEQLPDSFGRISRGLERVNKIIKAMKIFTHSSTHEKADIDINQNIEMAVLLTKNEWKYVSEVDFNLDKNLPQIKCNSDEINQVLINLLVNAVHAIAEKKAIDAHNGKIIIETELQDNYCNISIKDTGIGIESHHLDRIFDPFFTTKAPGKGTGQGLSITHDIIVNKHNGKIFFDSERMKGTTVTIRLPIDNEN